MSQIRKINFGQALEMIHKNPKMFMKFIVIKGNKAKADYPKIG